MMAHLPLWLTWLALLGAFHLMYGGFFPNSLGRLGHDFAFFLPAYLDGYLWFAKNGLFAVPWFTPSFCAGLPFFADPQSGYYSIPQWLTFVVDPLIASYATLLLFASLGYFGMYRLCRDAFALSEAPSLLAAGLYFLNGALPHRLVVGHMSFHALTLVPWIAWALLRVDVSRFAAAAGAVMAGVAAAYWVHSGMVVMLVPAAASVLAVLLLHATRHGWQRSQAERVAIAVAVAFALSASKLVAGIAFVTHVTRPVYPRPQIAGLVDLARVVGLALFAPSEATATAARQVLTEVRWTVLPHEWAYQFSVAPLLAILVALLLRGRRRPVEDASPPPRSIGRLVPGLALAAVVLVPAAALYANAPVNRIAIALPWSALQWPMRWLALYLPLVPLATALILHRWLGHRPAIGAGVVAATLLGTLALNITETRAYYRYQPYDPGPVRSAYAHFAAGGAAAHSIVAVGLHVNAAGQPTLPLNRNDAFLSRISPMLCYNPIFGYQLEQFRSNGLTPGLVGATAGERLNFKNPACYLYPDDNACGVGERFRTDQADSLARLVDYRPIPFRRSSMQTIADWTTGLALAGLGLFAVVGAWRATGAWGRARPMERRAGDEASA